MKKSDILKLKSYGSVGTGSVHWWRQRFTAIFLTLLTGWIFYFSWEVNRSNLNEITVVFKKFYHLVAFTLLVLTGLYHSILGMQVVIEDYIHCRVVRLALLLAVQIFSIITATAFVLSIFYIINL